MTVEFNPLTRNKIPALNAACRDFLLVILIFKGLTARHVYKSFGVKGLTTSVKYVVGSSNDVFSVIALHFSR
jgi:hypothetical protein